MEIQKYLEAIGKKISASQGFSQDVSISPVYYCRASSGAVYGINNVGQVFYYNFLTDIWSTVLSTRNTLLYGTLNLTVTPFAVPTNNYNVGLVLNNPFHYGVGGVNLPVASRGSLLNPFIAKLNLPDPYDSLNYVSKTNEFIGTFGFVVTTDATGTLSLTTSMTFQGWRIQFN